MSIRTRSTTRPSRVEVERMSAPQAEISTAGVIIAVQTDRAELSGALASLWRPRLRTRAHYDVTRRARATSAAEVLCRSAFIERFFARRIKVLVRADETCAMLRRKSNTDFFAAFAHEA